LEQHHATVGQPLHLSPVQRRELGQAAQGYLLCSDLLPSIGLDTWSLLSLTEYIAATRSRGPSPVVHNVVYVATEGNTIYAIDASSGQILLNPNSGNPFPLPLGCSNNGPNVGINGTPGATIR
jgi:hypothetical protein